MSVLGRYLEVVRVARRLRWAARRVPREFWVPLARALKRRASNPPTPLRLSAIRPGRVIFVCHGNIMRSAFARAYWDHLLTREYAPEAPRAISAGTDARDGRSAHPLAIAAAERLGVDLSAHRAKHLATVVLREGDILVGFDCENEVQLQKFARTTRHTQVLLLGDLAACGGTLDAEIGDPWGTGEEKTIMTFHRICGLLESLYRRLAV